MSEREATSDTSNNTPPKMSDLSGPGKATMPQRLEKFPKDPSRGNIPIFYTVRTDANGTPYFTQVDYKRRDECIVNRKCGICGEDLGEDIVCIGVADDRTARVQSFVEAAMHEECAQYAVQVCPYLRSPGYMMREQRQVPDGETIEPLDRFTAVRPPKLALYWLSDYRPYRFRRETLHRVGGKGALKRAPQEF